MHKESDIAFELGQHWVLKVPTGYDVYRIGITHSTRCAQIGYKGLKGLERAIEECERREKLVAK